MLSKCCRLVYSNSEGLVFPPPDRMLCPPLKLFFLPSHERWIPVRIDDVVGCSHEAAKGEVVHHNMGYPEFPVHIPARVFHHLCLEEPLLLDQPQLALGRVYYMRLTVCGYYDRTVNVKATYVGARVRSRKSADDDDKEVPNDDLNSSDMPLMPSDCQPPPPSPHHHFPYNALSHRRHHHP